MDVRSSWPALAERARNDLIVDVFYVIFTRFQYRSFPRNKELSQKYRCLNFDHGRRLIATVLPQKNVIKQW